MIFGICFWTYVMHLNLRFKIVNILVEIWNLSTYIISWMKFISMWDCLTPLNTNPILEFMTQIKLLF
jgi:hypothetical protein